MKIKTGSWKSVFFIPVVVSLVLTALCYFYCNARFTFGFGDMSIRVSSALKDLLQKGECKYNVVAVNVSYDRALVPYSDKMGVPLGEIDITDRHKLLAFMDSLAKWDNYRYVVCDINFDGGIKTEWDANLFTRIAGMHDITVAGGYGPDAIHPDALSKKISCSTYEQFLSGDGFLKFTYLAPDGMESMAYRMWRELEGGQIKKHLFWWSSGGKLCVRSFIPDLKFVTRSDYSVGGEKNLYNLGVDILSEPDMSTLFENKIVLIGDFKEFDLHDTIKNSVAGTAIIYNSYLALLGGDHIVHFWMILLVFMVSGCEVFYAFRYFWIEKENKGKNRKKKKTNKKVRKFIVVIKIIWDVCTTLIGYTGVMAIVCFVIYWYSGLFVNAIIIGSIIAFISLFVEYSIKGNE